ncbi:SMP-30/gluconolactonase/LRE family protein [Litorivivens sp.]|uniref:SMP-30/gluconolactonase/LRE family protein n=1 Tax=Litorivivens sp. TaxID=2020868 RepID=UPI00356B305E
MSLHATRYPGGVNPDIAPGWQLERLLQPSRLYGANGLRTGADGRLYVAQVSGSQISAIDVDTGLVESISPMGGDIVAPDDLAFDAAGNLFATEITEGRVSMLSPSGQSRVVCGDMPCANPITIYNGRLFAGECRPEGRIMELDLNGAPPRIILENVPMPNAMEVGPDGKLYFPVMGVNEIWRVNLDGGQPEVVATELGVPDAVKFDADGFIVSTQVGSGQVLRINPATGEREVLATIAPGLDNLSFIGKRLFVSSISGQVNEILGGGKLRSVIPDGMQFPLGLAVNEDGNLFIADGGFTYTMTPGGEPQVAGMLFSPGFPGYTRGVAASAPGEYVVTTANGQIARWQPAGQRSDILAEGFDRLYGVALAGDTVFAADAGSGRLLAVRNGEVSTLAQDLKEPMGVAVHDDAVLVAEEKAGRVVKVVGKRVETVLDGLRQPQGILVLGDLLYIVDVGAKSLIELNLSSGAQRTLAQNLPVGAPDGVVPKFLQAIPPLSGPMGPFAGIAAGADGTLYLSGDADGSVIALRPIVS